VTDGDLDAAAAAVAASDVLLLGGAAGRVLDLCFTSGNFGGTDFFAAAFEEDR
jgi:uncharacterized protein YgbK (DUF1537 family)